MLSPLQLRGFADEPKDPKSKPTTPIVLSEEDARQDKEFSKILRDVQTGAIEQDRSGPGGVDASLPDAHVRNPSTPSTTSTPSGIPGISFAPVPGNAGSALPFEADDSLPPWATDDAPIWLEMMAEFLFQQPDGKHCTLLDVDVTPLPFFENWANPAATSSAANTRALNTNTEQLRLEVEDLMRSRFHYVHVPHRVLRSEAKKGLEIQLPENPAEKKLLVPADPLAVFGGTSTMASQANEILRQEGFRNTLNVQTFRYLRKLVALSSSKQLTN